MTPFFANYSFHPDYTVQKVRPSPPPDSPEVVQYVDRLQNLVDYLHAEITWMQDAQAEAAWMLVNTKRHLSTQQVLIFVQF